MRTKRSLAASTAALGMLALAACGGADDGGTAAPAASEVSGGAPSGELRIAGVNSDKDALEAAIAAFKAEYPDVEVTANYADVDPHRDALLTQVTSGTAPDFIQVWPGRGTNATVSVLGPAGHLEDLSDRPWAADVPEGLRPVLEADGKLFGLSTTVSGIGAVFNDQALAEVGGAAPTTFAETLALCETAASKGKVAFALGAQEGWVGQLVPFALAPELVYAEDVSFDEVTEYETPHFSESKWKDVLAKFEEMKEAGCFQDDATGTDYNASLAMVAKGEALGTVQGNWAIQALKEAAPSKETTFSHHALPASDDAEATRMAAAAAGTYGVYAKAKNKDNALAFIDFLASAEGTNAFAKVNAGLPGVPNDEFTPDPALTDLVDYFGSGKTYPFVDQLWPNPEVQLALQNGVQAWLQGDKTADDVLADMDESWAAGTA